jgi:hypothetical protein
MSEYRQNLLAFIVPVTSSVHATYVDVANMSDDTAKALAPVIRNRKEPLDKFETGQRSGTSKNKGTWSHLSAYSQHSPAGSSAYSQHLPTTQKQNTYIISVSHRAN